MKKQQEQKQLKKINTKPFPIKPLKILSNREQCSILLIILLATLAIYLAYFTHYQKGFDLPSTIIGFLPTLPVIFLWWQNRKKEWINNLPSFLDLYLEGSTEDNNRIIAFFEAIPIQNHIDLRAQAQTLLKTLVSEDRHINGLELFLRSNKLVKEKVVFDQDKVINQGKPYEQHEITLKLHKPVQDISNPPGAEKQSNYSNIKIAPKHYYYWCPEGEIPQYQQHPKAIPLKN